jgi:hypothetical protein
MAAITVQQLTERLVDILTAVSNDAKIAPADARQSIATGFAAAINDFVVGRQVTVPAIGLNAGNVPVTGAANGTIQNS